MLFLQTTMVALAILGGDCVQAKHIPYVLRRDVAETSLQTLSPWSVQRDLGPQLSRGSSIFFPGEKQFANATSRWNAFGKPNISVVIEPTTADDITAIVKFANSNGIPFLAVNRGHGSTYTLAKVHHGIEIWMKNFATISINPGGQSALMGGGVYGDMFDEVLDQYNKTSAIGVCGCVGAMGAGLGGGHGRLQGFYGLIADNIIDAHVVLANGSQVNVSTASNQDLFWALRGAGHNFGIVAHYNYRIHDQPSNQWFWAVWYFTQDKLEDIFGILQNMSDTGIPPEMGMILTDFLWEDTVSATEPVIYILFTYTGSAIKAARFADRFRALKPASSKEGTSSYGSINKDTGTSASDNLCIHGKTNLQFAAGLIRYNVTASRAIYNTFKDITIKHPEFKTSFVVFETYAQGGFKAVLPSSTAYPHREDNFICTAIFQYDASNNSNKTFDETAMAFGEQIRQMAYQGTDPAHTGKKLTTYLNYAVGSESLPQLYGWEPWRLEKLGKLKEEWDPLERFGYYEGIPAA